MITIAKWNSLDQKVREDLAKACWYNMSDVFQREMSGQFNHNFSSYPLGEFYRVMLKSVSIRTGWRARGKTTYYIRNSKLVRETNSKYQEIKKS